ncbi:MAG: M50 family metallopeptidase [Dehalococcoidia bacterium]|nr:M50 family metallopeptidase [Dehalococcoidia bacterium]
MDLILHTILPFAGILIVLIVVHELGHYITAKLTGVKVLEAGLGYPPRIWGFTWRGTLYSINWLPLGGFVRLLGEEDPSDPESLAAKPRWVRLIVLFAGSGMNFLLPIFLFALAFMIPRDVNVGLTEITGVAPHSPAEEAGLKPGDVIFAIDGDKVRNVREVSLAIRLNVGETVDFNVKHSDGVVEDIPVYARWTPPKSQGPTGIQIGSLYAFTEKESFPPWEAIPKGWTATIDSLILARNEVISMVKGGSGPDVTGPVGIAQATGEVVEQSGWQTLLEFAALLSINLAIINILPLPMLDGGRIAFVLLEIVRRGRRIAPEKEAIVHLVGLALIITFAVVITYFDVIRLIRGDSLFR